MSWELERAIETVLKAATRNKKNLYPNELKALQTITDYAQGQKVMQVQSNVLFAKMLGIYIAHALEGGRKVDVILNTIRTYLQMTVNEISYLIVMANNNNRAIELFESLGISDPKNLAERQENEALIKQHQQYILKELQKGWTAEKAYQSLINQANSFIENRNIHDDLRVQRQWELESMTTEQARLEFNKLLKEMKANG